MKFNRFLLLSLLFLSACSEPVKEALNSGDEELLNFANANCFFWYLKSKNYDVSEISKITGGIVEMSTYSPEKFQNVAFLVKSYHPDIKSKRNVDIELAKCFYMRKDPQFINELRVISKS